MAQQDIFAGVDLGGTKIACALARRDGAIIAEKSVPTESHRGPHAVIATIADTIESLGSAPTAVGIGLPGLIDFAQATTLFMPNFPTQWRGVPVGHLLWERLRCPVHLLNDARAATLGELIFGHGREARTMVLFTVGTGIGGGIVIDGKLRMGPLGAAGELGHQTVVIGGPLCGCGAHGCLEAVASGPALIAEGVRLMLSGNAPKLHEIAKGNPAAITPREMAAAAEAGENTVADAIERAATYLGIGAANMVTALHPDLIVIGGGVSALGDRLLRPIRREIHRRVRMFPPDDVRVERSLLGEKAGLLGAVALAMGTGIELPTQGDSSAVHV